MRVFPRNVPSRVLNFVDIYGQLKAFSGFIEYQNCNRLTVLRCTKHLNRFLREHSLCTLENRGLFLALKQFVTSDLPYNSV